MTLSFRIFLVKKISAIYEKLVLMKFYKKNYIQKVKIYTSFFLILFLIHHSIANGSERKKYLFDSRKKYHTIEEIYKRSSIPYNEYDNFNNQLNTFFGLKSVLSDKSYYPDLMLINDSWSIREIYKSELNNMTINKNNYMIRNESFFKD